MFAASFLKKASDGGAAFHGGDCMMGAAPAKQPWLQRVLDGSYRPERIGTAA